MARPPKPTHLKAVAGNPGRRKLKKNEPTPEAGIPRCPANLSTTAKRIWRRIAPELEKMGVLKLSDGLALEMLCDAYAEYRDARDIVEKNEPTYVSLTKNGLMHRTRPEVAIASDAYRRVKTMMTEFGLTPSSRSRVSGVDGQGKQADPWAEFNPSRA